MRRASSMVNSRMIQSLLGRLRNSLAQGSVMILLAVAGCGTQPLGPGSLDGNWRIVAGNGASSGEVCISITTDRVTAWLAGCATPWVVGSADLLNGRSLGVTFLGDGRIVIELSIQGVLSTGQAVEGLMLLDGVQQADGKIAGTMTVFNYPTGEHDSAGFLMERR